MSGIRTVLPKQAITLLSKAVVLSITPSYYISNISSAASFGRYEGYVLFLLGIALGVGCGAYSIHKFCEENLDKFVEYYKKNSNKIKNSLEEATNYFLIK